MKVYLLCLLLALVAQSAICSNHLPVHIPTQVDERGCDSSLVSFELLHDPNVQCGGDIYGVLRNRGNCTLTTGGALICNDILRDCDRCVVVEKLSDGWLLRCKAINFNGVQVVTDTYLLGPLQGTIANATRVGCANPSPTPQVIIPHTPVACDPVTLTFTLEGPFTCGGNFTAFLTTLTTPGCELESGGALVCDYNGVNCRPCNAVTGANPQLRYDCTSIHAQGQQIVTATYRLGPYTGTIANAADFGCPLPS